MYKNLTIKNFRQFQDKEILLGKRITVLAGRNSTGKSTILGLLANSGELKKKDGTTFTGRRFRAEFSEILHGSKQYDASGSEKIKIEVVDDDENVVDYRSFRTAWQKDSGKDRFRIIPLRIFENGKKTEAKMPIPVLYLGLSRLFPIGEADEDRIQAKSVKFDDENQKTWFFEQYLKILSMHEVITCVDNYSIGETSKKNGVGIETKKYNYLTNSAGQDNLGQILLAILSFKRIKSSMVNWNGGILLIDEIDATLHPAAQKRLIDLLAKEAKNAGFQVVVTTHSSDLLKHVCSKTKHNDNSCNNEIELYYFTNANRKMEIKRNPEYSSIDNDLQVTSMLQNSNKVKLYSEDAENRWFIKNLVPDLISYVDILDVRIGCSQLMSLYKGDLNYFGNAVIVFDGDVSDNDLNTIPEQLRKRLNNIVRLPGVKRPEEVLYDYIISLQADHPYWEKASIVNMSWDYFHENGPLSDRYKAEKDREKYKKWFLEHEKFFETTKLFEFWKDDNEEITRAFRQDFINAYNAVADRTFAIKIRDGSEVE